MLCIRSRDSFTWSHEAMHSWKKMKSQKTCLDGTAVDRIWLRKIWKTKATKDYTETMWLRAHIKVQKTKQKTIWKSSLFYRHVIGKERCFINNRHMSKKSLLPAFHFYCYFDDEWTINYELLNNTCKCGAVGESSEDDI